jgi:hypothetical protein
VPVTVTEEMALEVPYEELWAGSGHADASAEAFITGMKMTPLKYQNAVPNVIAPLAIWTFWARMDLRQGS